MLLQAKCKYVINIIGRNHLELDIKGVCMKQKTKTYFKGLFEYLKGLGVIKIILYVFSIVLFIAEFSFGFQIVLQNLYGFIQLHFLLYISY